jgi:hypothetical protein
MRARVEFSVAAAFLLCAAAAIAGLSAQAETAMASARLPPRPRPTRVLRPPMSKRCFTSFIATADALMATSPWDP